MLDSPPEVREVNGGSQRLRQRGSNQTGMRQFNERVVLQAIRLHGALPKAEIARQTHLTPQTVALIIARLEADGLVLKRDSVRGKVGQPSVPIALDPDGAFAVGIKVGRRSLDVLLVDFAGHVRERLALDYAFPDPDTLFEQIDTRVRQLRQGLPPRRRQRLHGIGIAAPLWLGGWQRLLGVAPKLAMKWDGIDIGARVEKLTDLPVWFAKDTAAACVAELVAGRGRTLPSFLYVFVDTFVGGGVVLESRLHRGLNGNAGAIGSLALRSARARARTPEQLLSIASLRNLEALYQKARLDTGATTDERALAKPWYPHTQRWLEDACAGIALAIHGAVCVLDVEHVILDGSFCRPLLDQMLAGVVPALDRYNWEGVVRPTLLAGTIGADARAIGGALLPLYACFAPDRELFLKVEA